MNGRYCISLERYGRNFFESIKDMGIGCNPRLTDQQVWELQQYLYKDCVMQISNVITGHTHTFLSQLMQLPYVGNYMEMDQAFFSNPIALQNFVNHFRVFAFGMYERITTITGVQFEKDYTVEACTLDHLVVLIEDKI